MLPFVCRKRRLYSIFAFIAIACAIFICFQLFSLQMLDSYAEHNSRRNKQLSVDKAVDVGANFVAACVSNCSSREPHKNFGLHWQKDTDDERDDSLPKLVFEVDDVLKRSTIKVPQNRLEHGILRRQRNQDRLDFDRALAEEIALMLKLGILVETNVWKVLEKKWPTNSGVYLLTNDSHIPRGIFTAWQHLYDVDAGGFYTCILSKERIAFDQVNDDYCDCIDSTDEPGTAACPAGRFYCRFQSVSGNPRWLPSSRVNDGICDCCDGSDEWQNVRLADHVALYDGAAHYGIHQVPCVDRCQELRRENEAQSALRKQGARLKKDYVIAGRGQKNPSMIYGSDGAFYKLGQQCWMSTIGKYEYSVCPFGSAKQTSGGHETVIGRNPKWLSQGPIIFKLMLYDGDSLNCPEQNPRTTKMEFECGVTDEILSISESELCSYVVRFVTPAAC